MNNKHELDVRAMDMITHRMKVWFESFGDRPMPTPDEVRQYYHSVYEDVHRELGLPPRSP